MQANSEHSGSLFKSIATKHGVSEAQVLLRWGLQKGYPALPKSAKPERIRQNADLFSFELSAEEMAKIDATDSGNGVAWGSEDPLNFR